MAYDNNFRLHYFPNIPDLAAQEGERQEACDRSFQPLDFCQVDINAHDPADSGRAGKPSEDQWTEERVRLLEQQSYEKGYREGEANGVQIGKNDIEPALNSCSLALTQLETMKTELRQHAERAAVELALAVARKVVSREVSVNKDTILDVVREAMKRIVDHDTIRIRVRPEDLPHLRGELTEEVASTEGLTFEEDASIGIGGCIIETNFGDIDATLQTQLAVLEKAFRAETIGEKARSDDARGNF